MTDMKDLYVLLEEAAERMVFPRTEDISTLDIPFDTALAIADESNRRALLEVDDEISSY